MTIIEIVGWKEGLEKVNLTKLQMELLDLTLPRAKKNVDDLLNGNIVEIEVKNTESADLFLEKAFEMGAVCRIKK